MASSLREPLQVEKAIETSPLKRRWRRRPVSSTRALAVQLEQAGDRPIGAIRAESSRATAITTRLSTGLGPMQNALSDALKSRSFVPPAAILNLSALRGRLRAA